MNDSSASVENKMGTLYIVSTPIGNIDDITLRAVEILKKCDIVVCEEAREGAKLLRQRRVSKTILELNEHNESAESEHMLDLLRQGKTLALISDCGTPLLADPGQALVRAALKSGLPVQAVPGVSSVITALVTSGLPTNSFTFVGFLKRKPELRLEELRQLTHERRTLIFLETPYRLLPLLRAAAQVFPARDAYLGCNLTMPSETHHYGSVRELLLKFEEHRFKGEFVLCVAGNRSAISQRFYPTQQNVRQPLDKSRSGTTYGNTERRSEKRPPKGSGVRKFNRSKPSTKSGSRRDPSRRQKD